MKLSFLFWNLNKKPLWDRLVSIIQRHDIDIVILAECPEVTTAFCKQLSECTQKRFHFVPGQSPRLQLVTCLREEALTPVFDDPSGRLTIRRLRIHDRRIDILLAAVHLPSKLYYPDQDQQFIATEIARDIDHHESRLANTRTVLVGDFNMNPFDNGIVGAGGLHAVMTRNVANGNTRRVEGREYRYFYNPMWSCFGDRSEGPAGTYYYRKTTHISYFWNIFDQVLLRPELMHWLRELKILDSDGSASLVDEQGRPDPEAGSDHLPLYFCLQP